MSEDRDKHDRAGEKGAGGYGVGRSPEKRRTEGKAGMGQDVPDKVRAEIEGKAKSRYKGKP